MTTDPKRLVVEIPSSPLAEMLRVAEEDVLSGQGFERLRATLAASGIAGTAATAAGTSAAATKPVVVASAGKVFGLTLVKVAIAALAIAVVATGAFVAQRSAMSHDRATTEPAPAVAKSSEVPPAIPSAEPTAAPSAEIVEPAPTPSASASTASLPSRAPMKPRPAASASPPTIREGALLLEARSALDKDPARSLALVQQHMKEFPVSQLAPERSRIEQEARKRIAGER